MPQSNRKPKITGIRAVSCAVILGGILAAGLWPFHAPKNEVAWLAKANGLRFGRYGAILSDGPFRKLNQQNETSRSLELWLAPGLTFDTSTLLAFYTPYGPSGFSLHQLNRDLVLENEPWSHENHTVDARLYVDGIFHQGRSVFITVTSDGHETAVYVNGVLVQGPQRFAFSATDLKGQLVVANSPVTNDSWSGELLGLAVYGRELTSDEIYQHYASWTKTGQPDRTENERTLALYRFDEHSGSVIYNRAGASADLYIPERYMELNHTLLKRPWNEYHPGWSYWKNVLINIGGFVPLGFLFYAYLSLALRSKRAAIATVVWGAAISLTIEVLQAFLPTRDSGMTDIITNTLGTGVGVALHRWTGLVRQHFNPRYSTMRRLAELFVDGQCCETDDLEPLRHAASGR
ncbi:MAG: VanZ family protein [Terriglobia bacterium]